MRTILIIAALIICNFGVTGCTPTRAHDGGAFVGSSNVAIVRPHGVTFHKVNSVDVGLLSTGAEILPGKNTIELSINESNFTYPGPNQSVYVLELNAEAGKEYAVTGQRGGDGRLCAFEMVPETRVPNFSKPAGCVEYGRPQILNY